MDNMGNSMDAYFPGAYSMGNNMQPSQQNYMDVKFLKFTLTMTFYI